MNLDIDSTLFGVEKNISDPPIFVPNPNYSLDANNKLFEDFQEKSNIIDYPNHFNNSAFNSIYSLDKNEKKEEFEKTSEVTAKITENNLAKIEKSNNKIFEITKVKKEKRVGRKRKRNHDGKEHTKYDKDNVHTKIQVNFITFLFSFINEILIYYGIKEKFLDIAYKDKKDVTKDNVENLKTTEIGQILRKDITTKYKIQDKENNNKLYLKVIKNESIKKILSEKYINIFRNLYYKNKRDLNDYGLNIQLSDKVKTYQDLLDKNSEDSVLIEKIKDLVKYCYLPQKFITQK